MIDEYDNCSHAEEIRIGEKMLQEVRAHALELALGYIGAKSIKYIEPNCGMDPEGGFDCSGFVVHTLGRAAAAHSLDLALPRHANEQWRNFGEYVAYGQRRSGDLVYFPSRKKGGLWVAGHVGIVLDESTYIHAPGKDDTEVGVNAMPERPEQLEDVRPNDLHTHTPIGIKRMSLPFGDGRWHVY